METVKGTKAGERVCLRGRNALQRLSPYGVRCGSGGEGGGKDRRPPVKKETRAAPSSHANASWAGTHQPSDLHTPVPHRICPHLLTQLVPQLLRSRLGLE